MAIDSLDYDHNKNPHLRPSTSSVTDESITGTFRVGGTLSCVALVPLSLLGREYWQSSLCFPPYACIH
jgi:hypothetical protein